jgi:hypothetical protein
VVIVYFNIRKAKPSGGITPVALAPTDKLACSYYDIYQMHIHPLNLLQKEMIQQHRQDVQHLRSSLPRALGGAPASAWMSDSKSDSLLLEYLQIFVTERSSSGPNAFVQWSPRLPPSRQSSYSHQLPRIKETRLHTPFKYVRLNTTIALLVLESCLLDPSWCPLPRKMNLSMSEIP